MVTHLLVDVEGDPGRLLPDLLEHSLSRDARSIEGWFLWQAPIVAIGGITLDNAAPLLQAGANYLAVINGLFGAPDTETVQQRARQFSQLIHAS